MFTRLITILIAMAHMANTRYIMYLTGQHDVVPDQSRVSDLTHVALAFMSPALFNRVEARSSWPIFTTVEKARLRFKGGTAIMVAVGGWGDTGGFEVAAATGDARRLFARNVKMMVEDTGADGVDIDWEYPGGNGEDYKQIPNSKKAWEIEAYPLLLAELRSALGPTKLISAAVPGLTRDMLAFTKTTVPAISASLDFFNVMTYDLMNRRDNVTKHHSGIEPSLTAINAYEERGVPANKMNLGFAFYVKWFKTASRGGCDVDPVGCRTALMEDPATGADLGRAGAFSWHDRVPADVSASFEKAMTHGTYDSDGGGHYYWDPEENIWWSWDSPDAIAKKFSAVVEKKGLGGAFAWGLGEDADEFIHLETLNAEMKRFAKGHRGGELDVTSAPLSSLHVQDEL